MGAAVGKKKSTLQTKLRLDLFLHSTSKSFTIENSTSHMNIYD